MFILAIIIAVLLFINICVLAFGFYSLGWGINKEFQELTRMLYDYHREIMKAINPKHGSLASEQLIMSRKESRRQKRAMKSLQESKSPRQSPLMATPLFSRIPSNPPSNN